MTTDITQMTNAQMMREIASCFGWDHAQTVFGTTLGPRLSDSLTDRIVFAALASAELSKRLYEIWHYTSWESGIREVFADELGGDDLTHVHRCDPADPDSVTTATLRAICEACRWMEDKSHDH